MLSKLKLLPRYLLNLGLFRGGMIHLNAELLQSNAIKVKGFERPIYLRPESTDILVFREVFLFKSYDLMIENPSVIIDGGANIGLASLFLNKKFGHSTIYSIEPDDSNFSMLCKNTAHIKSIIPIHSALWNKDSFLRISDKHSSEWALEVEECDPGVARAFQGLSLYSIMKKYSIPRIDLLKLDIEGAERELFLDNYDYWMSRTKHILVELHDWIKADCSKTVFGALSAYRFTTTIVNGMLLLTNQDID